MEPGRNIRFVAEPIICSALRVALTKSQIVDEIHDQALKFNYSRNKSVESLTGSATGRALSFNYDANNFQYGFLIVKKSSDFSTDEYLVGTRIGFVFQGFSSISNPAKKS